MAGPLPLPPEATVDNGDALPFLERRDGEPIAAANAARAPAAAVDVNDMSAGPPPSVSFRCAIYALAALYCTSQIYLLIFSFPIGLNSKLQLNFSSTMPGKMATTYLGMVQHLGGLLLSVPRWRTILVRLLTV